MPMPMPSRMPMPPGPMPKSPEKPPAPAPSPKPGLFGEWRTFSQIREGVRKAPDKQIPGFDDVLFKSGREKAAERLQGYAKQYLNKPEGLGPNDIGRVDDQSSLLGKLFQAAQKAEGEEAKQLKKDIKTLEDWKKNL